MSEDVTAGPRSGAPMTVVAIDDCRACRGNRLKPLAMAYEHRGRCFPAVECERCGMRFLAVQPAADALAELYGADYFESDFRCGRTESHSFSEAAFRDENLGLLDAFAVFGPPGRLLEVGSAGGWLLKHAADRGWQAKGVELSAEAVAHSRSIGTDVFQGDLLDAGLPAASFDLVYMGDVLEHVPDCRRSLEEVARVLRPGGHFFLRGPITTNSLARRLALGAYGILGRRFVLREPPYHLWEFTPRSLRRLLDVTGFDVVRWRESKIPPGRAHGRKSGAQRAAMYALDLLNAPITALANRLGDRVVLAARRR